MIGFNNSLTSLITLISIITSQHHIIDNITVIRSIKYPKYFISIGGPDLVTPNTKMLDLVKLDTDDIFSLDNAAFVIQKGSHSNLVLKDEDKLYRSSVRNNTLQMTNERIDHSYLRIKQIKDGKRLGAIIMSNKKCLTAGFTVRKSLPYIELAKCIKGEDESQIWEFLPKVSFINDEEVTPDLIKRSEESLKKQIKLLDKRGDLEIIIEANDY